VKLYDPTKLYRCAICNRPQYMRYLQVVIWSSETPKLGEHVRCRSERECALPPHSAPCSAKGTGRGRRRREKMPALPDADPPSFTRCATEST